MGFVEWQWLHALTGRYMEQGNKKRGNDYKYGVIFQQLLTVDGYVQRGSLCAANAALSYVSCMRLK